MIMFITLANCGQQKNQKEYTFELHFSQFFCPWWGLNFDPKRNDPSPAAAIHKLEKNVVRFTLLSVFFFLFTFYHICKIVYFAKTGIRKITLHLLGETSLYQISLGTIQKNRSNKTKDFKINPFFQNKILKSEHRMKFSIWKIFQKLML